LLYNIPSKRLSYMLWHFKPDELHFHKFAFWIKWFLLDIIVVKALLLTYEHIFKLQSSYVNVQVCIKFWCSFSLCEILVVCLWVVVITYVNLFAFYIIYCNFPRSCMLKNHVWLRKIINHLLNLIRMHTELV